MDCRPLVQICSVAPLPHAGDYTVWRDSLGRTGTGLAADGNINGAIDAGDYAISKAHVSQHAGSGAGGMANAAVPEPATLTMLLAGMLTMCVYNARLCRKLSTP